MLVKKSFSIAGHRTSIALEEAFWRVLEAAAARRGEPLGILLSAVDAARSAEQPLASALRLRALCEAASGGPLAYCLGAAEPPAGAGDAP